MSRNIGIRLALASLLVAAACSGTNGEDDASPVSTVRRQAPPVPSTEEPPSRSTPGNGSNSETGSTVVETTAPATSGPPASDGEPDESVPDPNVPAEGLRAQLHKEVGGDLVDPCGLFELGRPEVVDPPVAFVGPAASYGKSDVEYSVGSAPSWCVYDYELGAPISVVLTAPDGTATSHELVLDASGSPCTWRCALDHSLVVGAPSDAALAVRTIAGARVDGVLGGWISPLAPVGRYVLEASQPSPSTGAELTSRSEFLVVPSPRPGVPIASLFDGDDGQALQMFVVGHPPDTVVRPGLFISDPSACDAPECEGAVGPSWRFADMLENVEVDARGEAIVQIDGTSLPPGEYCVMTAHTIPGLVGEPTLDPCFWLAEFSASFSRTWLPVDSAPGHEVLVTKHRGGAVLSDTAELIALWDDAGVTIRDRTAVEIAFLPHADVFSVEFVPRSSAVLLRDTEGFSIWDPLTDDRTPVADRSLRSPILTMDGRFLMGVGDDEVRWWNLTTGEEGVLFDAPGASQVGASDDLETVGVSGRSGLFVSGQVTGGWVQLSDTFVTSFDISPDGSRVIVVEGGGLVVHDLETGGQEIVPVGGVRAARFSTQGDLIASAGQDGVIVSDLDGNEIGRLTDPAHRWASAVTFASDDEALLISSRFGVVLVDVTLL